MNSTRAAPPVSGGWSRRGRADASDRGAVSVEAAIALFALVAALAMTIGGVAVVVDQIRCTDAAREAARLAARGDHASAKAAVSEIAPDDARLRIDTDADGITVEVHAEPVGGLLPGIRLSARAFAVPEPGVASEG